MGTGQNNVAAYQRLILCLAAAALLSGCMSESELKSLRSENAQLKNDLQQRISETQIIVTRANQQAAIAAACDDFFRVCPTSITAEGRKLIAEGFGGGNSFYYWLIMLFKFVIAAGVSASFLGGLTAGFNWVYNLFVKPTAEKIDAARRLVDGVEAEVKELEKKEIEARRRFETLKKDYQEKLDEFGLLYEEIQGLDSQIQERNDDLSRLEALIAKKNEEKAALAAFK